MQDDMTLIRRFLKYRPTRAISLTSRLLVVLVRFAQDKNIFKNPVLASIAAKHKKSVPQVILRWLTQRGVVVIPKSVSKQRIIENINIFDFELAPEDIHAISQLDTKKSNVFNHHDPASVKFLGSYRFDI